MVAIDDKPTMIFRNPAKDMLTLAITGVLRGKLLCLGSFSKRGGNRRARSQDKRGGSRSSAPPPKQKRAKEAAELAETNKVEKVAVTLPADATDVKQTKDQIKFTVGKGKAKAAVESLRTQFRDAGWKENFACNGRHERRSLFLKRRRAEC